MKRTTLPFAVLLAGCSVEGVEIAAASTPLVLEDALAYFDPINSSVIVVDPSRSAGQAANRRLARVVVGEKPVSAHSLPVPEDPALRQLVILDPGAEAAHVLRDKTGTLETLDLGIPLESIDARRDGRFAVAYQTEGATPTRSLFAFPNTIAVLDLSGDGAGATAIQLGSASARPLRAVFADSMELTALTGPVQMPLALVFVKGGIVPVDLASASAGELMPLTPNQDKSIIPAEVLFSNNRGDDLRGSVDGLERAFVRTDNGALYVLAVMPDPTSAAGVLVALENVVTPDAIVHDVELFFEADGNELLLAAAGNELILVDGYTGVATRFNAPTGVDRLVRFEDPQTGAALALGFSEGAPEDQILRIDPLALNARRSTGIEILRLGSLVRRIDVAHGVSRAVLQYVDGRDLGVMDLETTGSILDLRFSEAPSTQSLAPSGERLWLAGTSPDDGSPRLAVVELGTSLASEEVELDRTGTALGQVGAHVWVDHGDERGAVTFFPIDDLRRESARSFEGVMLTDLFAIDVPDDNHNDNLEVVR